jgi:predicted aminopeptidase
LGELVHLLIHESVHATAYVKGQSIWNESLAEFFSDRTIERVLERLVSKDSPEWIQYFDSKKRESERRQWFYEAYLDLEKIYQSEKSREEKIRLKAERISTKIAA